MPAGGAWHKFESGMNCPASARYGRVRIQNLMDTRIDSVYVMRGARGGIWGILPLLNSWANVGGAWPAFNALKDLNSRVYLRGALTGGTLGAVVVQMPTWARPKYDFEVPVYAWDGAAIAHVICNVRANGDVILWGDTNYHVDLAAVNWVAE